MMGRASAHASPWFTASIPALGVTLRSSGALFGAHPWADELGPLLNPTGALNKIVNPCGNHGVYLFPMFRGPRGGPRRVATVDWLPFGSPREVARLYQNARARD